MSSCRIQALCHQIWGMVVLVAKQRIDVEDVIDQAVNLVDSEGLQNLALSRVADELGVQASALYNHVAGLDRLRQAVAQRSSENLADTLRDAAVGRSGDRAVRAVASAYRDFAGAHPGQYASTLLPPATADNSTPAGGLILEVLARILETYGATGDTAVHLARIVRSAIHGFVTLEASQSFTSPQDTGASFDELLDFVIKGLNDHGNTDAVA